MIKLLAKRLFALALCCPFLPVFAQYDPPDSVSFAMKVYYAGAADQLPLFNALEYRRNTQPFKEGSFYFFSDSLTRGNVLYDGMDFRRVRLLYNQMIDELITVSYDGTQLVQLIKPKVAAFDMAGHHFVHAGRPALGLGDGYYESMYAGTHLSLLKKQRKRFAEAIVSESTLERVVLTDTVYFVVADSSVYPITGSKSFSAAFGKKKKEVSARLRQANLSYKTNQEAAIIEACRFYDNLLN